MCVGMVEGVLEWESWSESVWECWVYDCLMYVMGVCECVVVIRCVVVLVMIYMC